jgi:hypothetical protein
MPLIPKKPVEARSAAAIAAQKPAEGSFRQGWQEALRGETRPVSELWEDIDAG